MKSSSIKYSFVTSAENVENAVKKSGVSCPKKKEKSCHADEAKEFKKKSDYQHVTMEKNSYSEKLESSAKRVFDKYKKIKECKRSIQVIDWIPENVHIQSSKKPKRSLAAQYYNSSYLYDMKSTYSLSKCLNDTIVYTCLIS
ncbi:hypothetical protein LIER_33063 [Lithospermum erythrorhizon]|uniref:Uncharacterized protein n=1 Tax=Lithospermum erythrorhizon TaxID=34254 RepID=A0AAV3RYS9_LITER